MSIYYLAQPSAREAGIHLPDRELACAPIRSDVGQRYLGAMRAAMNCALANRQILTHLCRDAFSRLIPSFDGQLLYDRGIVYAPDYVINAGGIISCGLEYYGGSTEEELRQAIGLIPERLMTIFGGSKSAGRPTSEVADAWARRIVAAGRSNGVVELSRPTRVG